MASRIVIAGAGPAGITVAEQLRAREPDLEITLLSAEPYPPYSPPAMADHFLSGRDDTLYWKGRDICQRLELDFRGNTAITGIDTRTRALRLAGGDRLGYEQLVIATGSGLYTPVTGHGLGGVYNFKSLGAAERLIGGVRQGRIRSAAVVGAGFIGVEIALLLRELGVEVTMVEMLDRVMPGMLEPETAAVVRDKLRERGVNLRLNTRAEAFEGDENAEVLTLEDGGTIRVDAYIAATGVKPNIEWLEGSEIDTTWGVFVNDSLETSVPGVYACGDVAETRDRLTGEHYVHAIFPNAVEQARIVAGNVLGEETVYEGAEAMNSLKHLGVEVIAAGTHRDRESISHHASGVLRKLFLEDGRIVGYSLVGDTHAAGVYRSLMLRRVDIRPFANHILDPRPGAAWLASIA